MRFRSDQTVVEEVHEDVLECSCSAAAELEVAQLSRDAVRLLAAV